MLFVYFYKSRYLRENSHSTMLFADMNELIEGQSQGHGSENQNIVGCDYENKQKCSKQQKQTYDIASKKIAQTGNTINIEPRISTKRRKRGRPPKLKQNVTINQQIDFLAGEDEDDSCDDAEVKKQNQQLLNEFGWSDNQNHQHVVLDQMSLNITRARDLDDSIQENQQIAGHAQSDKSKKKTKKSASSNRSHQYYEDNYQDDEIWVDQVKRQYQKVQKIQALVSQDGRQSKKKIPPRRDINGFIEDNEDGEIHRFRKRRISENRKAFTKEQLANLKKDFDQMYNQSDSDDEKKNSKRQNPRITLKRLADKYGAGSAAIAHLHREWRFDPTFDRVLSKFNREFTLAWGGKTGNKIVARGKTEERICMLDRIIHDNPFLTQYQMAVALRKMDPSISGKAQRSLVLRLLRMGSFSKKKLRLLSKQRNSPQNINLRKQYAIQYKQNQINGFKPYFYDQMLINQHYDKDAGWCRSDGQVNYHPQQMVDRSIIVVGMLSTEGQLFWNIKFGDYAARQLRNIIVQMIFTQREVPGKKMMIVNVQPHRNKSQLQDTILDNNWRYLQLPSHGMQLNPLYPYFLGIKDTIRKTKFESVQKLFKDVEAILLKQQQKYYGKKFVTCIDMYLERAMNKY